MPRPGPRRSLENVRLSDAGRAFLEEEADRLGVTRSDVIRAALAHWASLPKHDRVMPKEKP